MFRSWPVAINLMIKSIFITAMVAILMGAACGPQGPQQRKQKLGEGAKTTSPGGYIEMCKEQPENELCEEEDAE